MLGVGGLGGLAFAAATLPFAFGCGEDGAIPSGHCHGSNPGWAAGGAIVAALSIPVGLALVFQHDDVAVSLGLNGGPGLGASLQGRF